jgi:large subunit ribosomal protein L25
MFTIEAQTRDKSQNLETLRKEGKMPAVFYGKKNESTPITITQKDFIKVWKEAGESGVVSIKTEKGSVETLIKEVSFNPVTDTPVHADFYVFEKGKKIELDVPLEFIGVSPAVKDLGGSLVRALHEIKISADPQHIPHDIKVDISSLVDFDSQILAGDLTLPTGVDLVELPTEVVATAAKPREEKEEESAPEKKGKKEEEAAPEN